MPAAYRKLDEIPFDFERRRLSVVVDGPGDRRRLITKGAPEGVLRLLRDVRATAAGPAPARRRGPRAVRGAVCQDSQSEGFRVLAVAYRAVAGAGRVPAPPTSAT